MSIRRTRHRFHFGASLLPLVFASSVPALTACAGGQALPAPAAPSAAPAEESKPAADAVQVRFQAEHAGQQWSLLSHDGKVVCDLPCTRWVSPDSGMLLELDTPGSTRVERIGVPTDLGVRPGGTVDAVTRVAHESAPLGKVFELFALCAGILGVVAFGVTDNRSQAAGPITLVAAVGVTGGLLATGVYLRATSHHADVVVRAASSSSSSSPRRSMFAFGPGFVEGGSASADGVRLVLSPLGAAGTF